MSMQSNSRYQRREERERQEFECLCSGRRLRWWHGRKPIRIAADIPNGVAIAMALLRGCWGSGNDSLARNVGGLHHNERLIESASALFGRRHDKHPRSGNRRNDCYVCANAVGKFTCKADLAAERRRLSMTRRPSY